MDMNFDRWISLGRGACAALMLAALALPAGAETLEDAYGLGRAKPKPEEWTKINEELSIRARILRDGTDKLAPRAQKGDTLRLDLSFYVQPGAKDRDIYLTCSVYLYDADGEGSDYAIKDRPCYKGRLHDGLERFQPLVLDFIIRPRETDPRGTSAVVVSVRDMVIKDGIEVAPTYNWQGGR
jgi:hypothetical protein